MSSDSWEDDDWEEPFDEDDEPELLPCPACGTEIYEEAERCPSCGEYIVHRTDVWAGKPMWWVILALIGIVATIASLAL